MLKINENKLVMLSVVGEVSSPVTSGELHSYEGQIRFLPQVGGITYNVKVGDYACGLQADHVEPGVSLTNKESPLFGGVYTANTAFNIFSQIGNEARVITGDAKGKKGVVTGKHGGIEHVIVDFEDETLEKLVIGDKVLVKSYGTGLELLDYPNIKAMNLSPELLKKIPVGEPGKKLRIPVTHKVPAKIMGSGLGSTHCYRGDYDIQFADRKTVEKYGLETLKFGDLVAIMDADNSDGRIYKTGAVSIGVVIHSDSVLAGHGPGVTTILTSSKGEIEPVMDSDSNIGFYLKIGKYREKAKPKKK